MNSNSKIYFFHYSNKDVLMSIPERGSDVATFSFDISDKALISQIRMDDPIVAISPIHKIRGGQVVNVDKNVITVELDKKCEKKKKRLYKRIPVSMSANLKAFGSNTRHPARIKDISKNGMLVLCEAEIPVENPVVIEIILEGKIIFVEAVIMRKAEKEHLSHYGVSVPPYDLLSLNNLSSLLRSVVANYQKKTPMEDFQISFDQLDFPDIAMENADKQMLNYCVKRFKEIQKRSKF